MLLWNNCTQNCTQNCTEICVIAMLAFVINVFHNSLIVRNCTLYITNKEKLTFVHKSVFSSFSTVFSYKNCPEKASRPLLILYAFNSNMLFLVAGLVKLPSETFLFLSQWDGGSKLCLTYKNCHL